MVKIGVKFDTSVSFYLSTYLKLAFVLFFLIVTALCQAKKAYANTGSIAHSEHMSHSLKDAKHQTVNVTIGEKNLEVPLLTFESLQVATKGTIILVSDNQTQSGSVSTMPKLAKELANWGWNAILITPTSEYLVSVPNNETNSIETSESDNNETPTNTEEDIAAPQTGLHASVWQTQDLKYDINSYGAFLDAVIAEVLKAPANQMGFRLVLLQGQSAVVGMSTITEQSNNYQIDGLVTINPYWLNYDIHQQVPQIIGQLQLPLLDLVSTTDSPLAKTYAQQRENAARVNLLKMYRQRTLLGPSSMGISEQYIAKEIVGWTTFMGW